MRGEHLTKPLQRPQRIGSSPHARGTHYVNAGTTQLNGIIPACAGNTFFPDKRKGVHRDHPRMRGEHTMQ